MGLSTRDKRKIEEITKIVVGIIPYIILVIVSMIFMGSVNSNDMLMKFIKIGLLIFNVFAVYHIIIRAMDLTLIVMNIRKV